MKITETITRECCEPKDMVKYHGRLASDYSDLYFCKHCGEAWQIEVFTDPDTNETDTRYVPIHEGKRPSEAFLDLASNGGAWVSSQSCTSVEIAMARVEGRWLQVDSLGFVLRDAQWLSRVEALEEMRCL